MLSPSKNISPSVGGRRVEMMDIVVDLPAPLGPRRPNTSPLFTSKLMPSTAAIFPKFLYKFSTFNIGHP
jgi:hypothetical protein